MEIFVIDEFIQKLPKAELHLHIEGTLEPELMFALAKKNKVKLPFASVNELKNAYQFSSLQSFLNLYYQGTNVLHSEQDFYDLTMAYLTKVASQNVKHVEIFFDPQTHTARGLSFATVIQGIYRALMDGQQYFGISFNLIMSFLRHLSEESSFATFEEASSFLPIITAVGLDSAEKNNPPQKFKRVFDLAREKGLITVAHAGEEGPTGYIWEALQILQVARIDHGIRAIEDPMLIDYLRERQIPLTICPLSNIKLCVYHSMTEHPLKKLLDAGLRVTINSDDPAYFDGYIGENYQAVSDAFNLTREDLCQLAKNSFLASFLPEAIKNHYIAEIEAYAKEYNA
jgi:adenosine deaminase